jgi:hypothetical protein
MVNFMELDQNMVDNNTDNFICYKAGQEDLIIIQRAFDHGYQELINLDNREMSIALEMPELK